MPRGDEAAKDEAPKPVSGVDIRTLPIGPHEAFVMSRVDGRAQADRIAIETGMTVDVVRDALRHLAELGAVTLGTPPPPAAEKSGPRSPTPSHTARSSPVAAPDPVIQEVPTLPSNYDVAELDAPGDLAPERKKDVLDHFHALGRVDHYHLLGVPRDADKKAIKSAYNRKVSLLHPDRYFRRDLGDFGPKLSAVFEAITRAHDVLSRRKTREEYDRHIGTMTPRPRAAVSQSGEHRVQVREINAAPRRGTPIPAGGVSSPVIPAQHPPRVSSPSVTPVSTPRPPLSPDERRRAAARRFGTSVPPKATESPGAPQGTGISQKLAAEAIRQRYEAQKVGETGRAQHYITQAAQAEAAGDLLSAVNALRVAQSIAPEDTAIAERLTEAEHAAARKSAPKHLEQAAYHEGRGEYAEAAEAFEKALRGRPMDASLMARTASCLVQAGTSLKRAAELAKKAVELAPDNADYRITLGRAYGRAGMIQSALAELERARTLAPSNDTIKQLIKKIRRGDG